MNVGGVYRALASRRHVDIRPANAVPVKKAIEKVSKFGPLVVALRGYDQAFPGGCYEVRINQGETRFFELNVDARMAKHSPLIFNAVPLATAPHEQGNGAYPPTVRTAGDLVTVVSERNAAVPDVSMYISRKYENPGPGRCEWFVEPPKGGVNTHRCVTISTGT